MSNVVSKSDPLTSSEITLIENLAALPASPLGQFIQKTGMNTFQNASPSGAPGTAAIYKVQTPFTIDGNTYFYKFIGLTTTPTFLVIDYAQKPSSAANGSANWSWNVVTNTAQILTTPPQEDIYAVVIS